MQNVWQKLKKKKTFFVLAPMAGVTDFTFREISADIGGVDLFFTEFISTEGVTRFGIEKYMSQLKFTKKQRPIIVQFFGSRPEQFEKCAKLAVKLGFDGIDINMGCPDRNVKKQGAGSELIRNPELAKEIIQSTIKGCDGKLPVSVKTRLGYNTENIGEYLKILEDITELGIDAITIHGRTVKQGYGGKADWEKIGQINKVLKKINPDIIVIGNGDIKTSEEGKKKAEKYGVDGIMIGREVLKNPWVFNCEPASPAGRYSRIKRIDPNIKDRLRLCLKHTQLFKKFYGEGKSFSFMKKYYRAYLLGFKGAGIMRRKLMELKDFDEAEKNVSKLLNK